MFRRMLEPANGRLTIYIDGVPMPAAAGESVAAVLLRESEPWSRLTPVEGQRRAPYCMMGVCFDCLAELRDGGTIQTCLTPVQEGMHVTRLLGRRKVT